MLDEAEAKENEELGLTHPGDAGPGIDDAQHLRSTPLASHPLAEKLQNCNSVESITAVLQDQAQAFCEFRGDNGKITKSLEGIVSVLYTLSASIAAIGLVRRKASIGVPHL